MRALRNLVTVTKVEFMKKLQRVVLAIVVVAGCASFGFARAEEGPAPKPEANPSVRLKGKSIVFDREKGDILIEGDVQVIRSVEEGVMTVDCEKMTAKMKEGKLENVLAMGNVSLTTKDYTAKALKASFDFAANIIVLYGEKERPASVKSAGMVSTGPKIIYHMDTQRVELPDGGETVIDIKESPAGKKPPGEKSEGNKE